MKLLYTIIGRMALLLLPVLAFWSLLFYSTMVDEINDETDDSLEGYAELIIRRTLAGVELPSTGDGSNNSFSLEYLGKETGLQPSMAFSDSLVYIPEKRETEPARILVSYFADADGGMYRLEVTMPTFEREDLLETLFWQVLLLFFTVLFTVFVAVVVVYNRSMRPMYRLLSWFDNYVPGRGMKNFPASSHVVEFRKLVDAARSTIVRAENHMEQQNQFLGNASHELQTPLAVLGNRIEWLLGNTELSEEQATELYKMQQSLRRLVRMNRTLLLLARIENSQYPEKQPVNLVPLIKENIELMSEIYSDKGLKPTIDLPASIVVSINEELARILVTNLVKNAFVHTTTGGTVSVTLQGGALLFANSGEAELDKERLFERFYKAGNSGNTGLGLALVGTIARVTGINVEYSFAAGMHRFALGIKTSL